jgi:hypothetical protein
MELIISDVGSVEQSVPQADAEHKGTFAELPFPVQVVWGGKRKGGLIQSLKESYRSQDITKRLMLEPFLVPLKKGIAALPSAERRRLWYRTGA